LFSALTMLSALLPGHISLHGVLDVIRFYRAMLSRGGYATVSRPPAHDIWV